MHTKLVNILTDRAKELFDKRMFDEAIGYSDKAIHLAKGLDNLTLTGKVLFLKSKILNAKGYYASDNDYFEDAENTLQEARNYLNDNTEILLHLGRVYFNRKNYDVALIKFKEALSIAEQSYRLDSIIQSFTDVSKVQSAQKQFKEALETIEKAFHLIDDQTDLVIKMTCYAQFITANAQMSNYDEVRKYIDEGLQLAQAANSTEHEVIILNYKAISYAIRGSYKDAFELFVQSKEKSEAVGLNELLVKALINIGNIYSTLYNHKEAYKNFKRILTEKELLATVSDYTLGILYFNFACTAYVLEKKEECMDYLWKSKHLGETHNNRRLIARALYELMRIYLAEGDTEKALRLANEAKKSHENVRKSQGSETHAANMAQIFFIQKNYDDAIRFGQEAIKICNKTKNLKTRSRSYKILAEAYKAKGVIDSAYQHLELFAETNETLFKEMRRRQIIDLEIKYEVQQREKQIQILQKQVQLQNLELQHAQEISQRNEELAKMQEEIKQFTYAVSHDLKEPLRMIGSFTKLLLRKYKQSADQTELEYFKYITDGVSRMSNLLNALLEYGQVGKHQQQHEWIDTEQSFKDVIITLHTKMQETNAVVEMKNLPAIFTNRTLFFQLIQNLVVNAIKFRKPMLSPKVIVQFKETPTENIFSIADNGIGIADEHKEIIFGVFKRLHSRDAYEGTGIGLAMCKKIVQHLNGRIWLTSQLGIGTTFYVALPKISADELTELSTEELLR